MTVLAYKGGTCRLLMSFFVSCETDFNCFSGVMLVASLDVRSNIILRRVIYGTGLMT